MKITETIERECCAPKDLKPYKGKLFVESLSAGMTSKRLSFCVHCGQIWVEARQMGPAGDTEYHLEKVEI